MQGRSLQTDDRAVEVIGDAGPLYDISDKSPYLFREDFASRLEIVIDERRDAVVNERFEVIIGNHEYMAAYDLDGLPWRNSKYGLHCLYLIFVSATRVLSGASSPWTVKEFTFFAFSTVTSLYAL